MRRQTRVLPRPLGSIGALITVGWGLAVTVGVLSDQQISADVALSIILATVVVPGFIGLCVIGFLWPLVATWLHVSSDNADERFDKNARLYDPTPLDRSAHS